jgi:uroporphyrin-III C-methyltransferase/precorrin-2 dehydrogenase/sirohydrochlorin ferrochelatase
LQILQEADVVLYDYLVSPDVLDLIRRDAKRICVGKRAGFKNTTQNKIIELLICLAKQGKKVVRLKGGDPFIFGRGGEEIEAARKNGINFQVVPGITSAIGIAAYTGIPLTHRKYAQGVIFITGHKSKNGFLNNWSILTDSSYTLVVYMGTLQAIDISKKLISYGRLKSTPIAVVGHGTTVDQKVIISTLNDIEKIINFSITPSLLIIGDVVSLHEKLSWFQNEKCIE